MALDNYRDQAEFKGLALVAFDVSITGETVTFAANPESGPTTKPRFLQELKETKNSGEFSANVVEDSKLADLFRSKKPLFCVHGWQGRPDFWLNECQKAQEAFDDKNANYQVVPILWSANDNGKFLDFFSDLNVFKDKIPQFAVDYERSRESASQAAKVLTSAFADIDDSIDMDILGVSMGTYVIKELAEHRNIRNGNFVFDNIFLSAADIRGDIFSRDEGQYIVDMLNNDNGNVHAFHNEQDDILKLSTNVYPDEKGVEDDGNERSSSTVRRLGGAIRRGLRWVFRVPDRKEKIERLGLGEKDAIGYYGSSGRVVNVPVSFENRSALAQHGYIFDQDRIEYYEGTL